MTDMIFFILNLAYITGSFAWGRFAGKSGYSPQTFFIGFTVLSVLWLLSVYLFV